jgi:hypothetical protein
MSQKWVFDIVMPSLQVEKARMNKPLSAMVVGVAGDMECAQVGRST